MRKIASLKKRNKNLELSLFGSIAEGTSLFNDIQMQINVKNCTERDFNCLCSDLDLTFDGIKVDFTFGRIERVNFENFEAKFAFIALKVILQQLKININDFELYAALKKTKYFSWQKIVRESLKSLKEDLNETPIDWSRLDKDEFIGRIPLVELPKPMRKSVKRPASKSDISFFYQDHHMTLRSATQENSEKKPNRDGGNSYKVNYAKCF